MTISEFLNRSSIFWLHSDTKRKVTNLQNSFWNQVPFPEFACIVTDVEMRQMSGLGLLQYLKNSDSAVPVIIITGKPSARSEAFYLESGAVGFFRKPVDGDALVELIGSVCV
jgi:FixJ family two-component response regulator